VINVTSDKIPHFENNFTHVELDYFTNVELGAIPRPNDLDQMPDRNETESHFGQNRNETELF
jgi:hypothetical protein